MRLIGRSREAMLWGAVLVAGSMLFSAQYPDAKLCVNDTGKLCRSPTFYCTVSNLCHRCTSIARHAGCTGEPGTCQLGVDASACGTYEYGECSGVLCINYASSSNDCAMQVCE